MSRPRGKGGGIFSDGAGEVFDEASLEHFLFASHRFRVAARDCKNATEEDRQPDYPHLCAQHTVYRTAASVFWGALKSDESVSGDILPWLAELIGLCHQDEEALSKEKGFDFAGRLASLNAENPEMMVWYNMAAAGDVSQLRRVLEKQKAAPTGLTAEAFTEQEIRLKMALVQAQGKVPLLAASTSRPSSGGERASARRSSHSGSVSQRVTAETSAATLASLREQLACFVQAIERRCQAFLWQAEALERPHAPEDTQGVAAQKKPQHTKEPQEAKVRASLQRALGLVKEVLDFIASQQNAPSEEAGLASKDTLAQTKNRVAAMNGWFELSMLAVVSNEVVKDAESVHGTPDVDHAKLLNRIIELERKRVALAHADILASSAPEEARYVREYLAAAKENVKQMLLRLKEKISHPLRISLERRVNQARREVQAAEAALEEAIRSLHQAERRIEERRKGIERQVAEAQKAVGTAKAECIKAAAAVERKARGLLGMKSVLADDLKVREEKLTVAEQSLAQFLQREGGEPAQLEVLLENASKSTSAQSGEVDYLQKYKQALKEKEEAVQKVVEAQKEEAAAIQHLPERKSEAAQAIEKIQALATKLLGEKKQTIASASAQREKARASEAACQAQVRLEEQSFHFRVAKEALCLVMGEQAVQAARKSGRRGSTDVAQGNRFAEYRPAEQSSFLERMMTLQTPTIVHTVSANASMKVGCLLATEKGDGENNRKRVWEMLNNLSLLVKHIQMFVDLCFKPCQIECILAAKSQGTTSTHQKKPLAQTAVETVRKIFLQSIDWYTRMVECLEGVVGEQEAVSATVTALKEQHVAYHDLLTHLHHTWKLIDTITTVLTSGQSATQEAELKIHAIELAKQKRSLEGCFKEKGVDIQRNSFLDGELLVLQEMLEAIFKAFPSVGMLLAKLEYASLYSGDIECMLLCHQYKLMGYSGENTSEAVNKLKGTILGSYDAVVILQCQPSDVSAIIKETFSRLRKNIKLACEAFPALKVFHDRVGGANQAAEKALRVINAFLPKKQVVCKPGEDDAVEAAKVCLARLEAMPKEDWPFVAGDMYRLRQAIAQVGYYNRLQTIKVAVQALRDATPENRAARIAAAEKCLSGLQTLPEVDRAFLREEIDHLQQAARRAWFTLSIEVSEGG